MIQIRGPRRLLSGLGHNPFMLIQMQKVIKRIIKNLKNGSVQALWETFIFFKCQ